ncbi:MAG: hypothetical protein J1F63_00260 [Oscillospiraceae bacterium]|nr:hypothetical protein [Oscillospiraceae bacterium]
MNAMRELDLEEIKNRLEDIRGELEQIAANERFAIGYSMGDPVSEEQYEEAEQAVCNVADAASRIEEAIEFVQEALK